MHTNERLLHSFWGQVVLMAYFWWSLGSHLALSCHTVTSYLYPVCSGSACSAPVAFSVCGKWGENFKSKPLHVL